MLKKVKGEDAVPLFQTLTFHIDIVHPPVLSHHLQVLYEKSNELYDFVSEQSANYSYTTYAIASVAFVALLALLLKAWNWCRGNDKRTNHQSIEAFTYEETPVQQDQDMERSKQQDYHNLAGSMPTTPAVF